MLIYYALLEGRATRVHAVGVLAAAVASRDAPAATIEEK